MKNECYRVLTYPIITAKPSQILRQHIPVIVDSLLKNDHNIGHSFYDFDEEGFSKIKEYESNIFCYDEDGLVVEITYECCGIWEDSNEPLGNEISNAWGYVTQISGWMVNHEPEDEIEFETEDLAGLKQAINHALKELY